MIIDSVLLKNEMLSSKTRVFLMIVFLHYNKIITEEKMKGMLRSLRKDTFIRRVNTHKCSITGHWYDNESTFEILKDAFEYSHIRSKTIFYKEFITYINLFLNKNYNYCLNWIYHELIEPTLKNIWNHMAVSSLQSFRYFKINLVSYDDYPYTNKGSWDYYSSCSYYSKSDAYNDYLRSQFPILKKEIINDINSLKIGRWELSPHQLN